MGLFMQGGLPRYCRFNHQFGRIIIGSKGSKESLGRTSERFQTFTEKFDSPHDSKANRYPVSPMIRANIHLCKGAFFTVQVCNTPRSIRSIVHNKIFDFGNAPLRLQGIEDIVTLALKSHQTCPLLIVDEADRITFSSLEELRAMYDEYQFGLILMGIPGIEKRLSRYAQLYSRIGFLNLSLSIRRK